MKIMKAVLKKFFALLGYEIHRLSEQHVYFSNFANLALTYEQLLNESGKTISRNEIRVKLLSQLLGTQPSKAYFIIDALAKCRNINGDICEFGVAQGATSVLIANEILTDNKNLHLFDSFQGLSKPTEKDKLKDDVLSLGDIKAYTGKLSFPEEMVSARLKKLTFPEQRLFIHKGFIEKVLRDDLTLPEKVSFAYVDFDFYEPIKLTLDFLHRKTSIGGIFIVDDYDFFSTGAKVAVDEFLEEKNSRAMIYELLVPDTQYGYFAVLTRRS
jgi:O-methyltransferase